MPKIRDLNGKMGIFHTPTHGSQAGTQGSQLWGIQNSPDPPWAVLEPSPAGNSLGMWAWPLWEFGNGSHGAFLSWEFLGNAPSGLQEWPPWVLPETENSSGMWEQPLREWFLGNTGMAPQDHSWIWEFLGNGSFGSFLNLGIPCEWLLRILPKLRNSLGMWEWLPWILPKQGVPWECGSGPFGNRHFSNSGIPWEWPPGSFPNLGILWEWPLWECRNGSPGSFPNSGVPWECRHSPPGALGASSGVLVIAHPKIQNLAEKPGFGIFQLPLAGMSPLQTRWKTTLDLKNWPKPFFFFTANSPSAAPGEMGRSQNPWKNPGESLGTARREREWRGAEPGSAPEGTSRFQHSDLARRELGIGNGNSGWSRAKPSARRNKKPEFPGKKIPLGLPSWSLRCPWGGWGQGGEPRNAAGMGSGNAAGMGSGIPADAGGVGRGEIPKTVAPKVGKMSKKWEYWGKKWEYRGKSRRWQLLFKDPRSLKGSQAGIKTPNWSQASSCGRFGAGKTGNSKKKLQKNTNKIKIIQGETLQNPGREAPEGPAAVGNSKSQQ